MPVSIPMHCYYYVNVKKIIYLNLCVKLHINLKKMDFSCQKTIKLKPASVKTNLPCVFWI